MTEEEAKKAIMDILARKIQGQVKILSERLLRDDTGHETQGSEKYRQQDGRRRTA